jgi:LacI family transcriptional regulator
MSKTRPTIIDIAQEAGVSLMTVSRVINHKRGVGPQQRQRIEEIIERLNYRPSAAARALVTRRSGAIGLVVPDISNPFFPDIALGVEQIAFELGYSLLLCNTEEDARHERGVLELLLEKEVDGIILCSSRLETNDLRAVLAQNTTAVLVNRPIELDGASPIVGTVLMDETLGGQLLANHLRSRGHQSIGYLAGPPASFSGRARLAGMSAALNVEMPHVACMPTVEGGYQTALEWLRRQPELTALVCFNDLVAVGALQAAAQLGRRVPHDLAITGYDDIYLASLVTPAITTCRVPRSALGREAARMLFNHLSGNQHPQEVVLQPELVVRAST